MLLDRYRRNKEVTPEAPERLQGRIFRHAPHVVWTTLRGETVVFDIERGKYESLNEVATSVWQQIIEGATFDAILGALQEEYELPTDGAVEQMKLDVAALIARLAKARVIVTEPIAPVSRA